MAAHASLLLARAGLRVFGYNRFRDWLPRVGRRTPPAPLIGDLRWAMARASRGLPAGSCLRQAIAVQTILSCLGYASTLHLGVKSDPTSHMLAHAWLESGGEILVGDGDGEVASFAPLTTLEPGLS